MQKPTPDVYRALNSLRGDSSFTTFYNWLTKESISLAIDAANTNDEVQMRILQGEHRSTTRLLKMIDESRTRLDAMEALELKRGIHV